MVEILKKYTVVQIRNTVVPQYPQGIGSRTLPPPTIPLTPNSPTKTLKSMDAQMPFVKLYISL